MAQSLLYRNCLIAVSTRFNEATKFWTGIADISWGEPDDRGLHTLTGPETRFTKGVDAEHFIIIDAKYWISSNPRKARSRAAV